MLDFSRGLRVAVSCVLALGADQLIFCGESQTRKRQQKANWDNWPGHRGRVWLPFSQHGLFTSTWYVFWSHFDQLRPSGLGTFRTALEGLADCGLFTCADENQSMGLTSASYLRYIGLIHAYFSFVRHKKRRSIEKRANHCSSKDLYRLTEETDLASVLVGKCFGMRAGNCLANSNFTPWTFFCSKSGSQTNASDISRAKPGRSIWWTCHFGVRLSSAWSKKTCRERKVTFGAREACRDYESDCFEWERSEKSRVLEDTNKLKIGERRERERERERERDETEMERKSMRCFCF